MSTAGLFALFSIRWWTDSPIRQWAIGIWWGLMSLSILTTKQHFILDLVTGLILLCSVWRWYVVPALHLVDWELLHALHDRGVGSVRTSSRVAHRTLTMATRGSCCQRHLWELGETLESA